VKKKKVHNKLADALQASKDAQGGPIEPARAISPISGTMVPPPQWKPGESGNPGGVAKGVRVTTYLVRYGQEPVRDWPKPGTEEFDSLPGNAQIAIKALLLAVEGGEGSTAAAWVVDRVEGKAEQSVTLRAQPVPTMSLEQAAEIAKSLPAPKDAADW